MSAIKIRNNIHLLVDKIDNENFLKELYDLISKRYASKEGQLWNQLSEQEQEELLLAFDESDNPDNLISNAEMKLKHKR